MRQVTKLIIVKKILTMTNSSNKTSTIGITLVYAIMKTKVYSKKLEI